MNVFFFVSKGFNLVLGSVAVMFVLRIMSPKQGSALESALTIISFVVTSKKKVWTEFRVAFSYINNMSTGVCAGKLSGQPQIAVDHYDYNWWSILRNDRL